MNPIIVNPGVHFQLQLKRLFPRKQSKKDRHVSVETLCRKSLRLCEVQCITRCTEHLFNAVTNGKPIAVKAHHLILRWLNGDKRAPKSLPKSSPPPHEHLDTPPYTLDPKWSFTQSVLEIENQSPPDYPDHGNVFLKVGRREKDDTSWKVRYAVECVDSILHSQSEHCGDAGPQNHLVHHVELAKPSTKPQLEHDFQHFYSSLTPFTLTIGSNREARIQDLIAADTWKDLFSDTASAAGDATGNMPARDGAGVSSATGITVSRRDHDDDDDDDQHPAPTTPEGGGRSGAGRPSKLPRPTALLDPQLLAEVATWEIDRLHERNSIELTLRREAVAAVSNFDVDFQSGGTSNVEWRRSRLGDTIPAERITLPTSESIGITKFSDNGTVSGRSYNGGAARASQASGAANQKLPFKRARDDGDRDEGKKRKKKDQRPQTPSGPSFKEVEPFSCPFKGRDSPTVKPSCSTNFPNLSKVKEHLRRAHFPHLQCPHSPCDFCAGSPFEINRHQQKHGLELTPIEQTINPGHLQKHKALKRKKLTWDAIAQICFSIDYTPKLPDGTSDEEDDGGDASEIYQVNESTSATDFDDEPSPNDEEPEEKPKQQWGGASTNPRPHNYTPNKKPLPSEVFPIIHKSFEAMKQKYTLRIMSHLEAHSLRDLNFDIPREAVVVLEGFDQAAESYSRLLATSQTNSPSCFNRQQTFTMQLNDAEPSYQNLPPPVHLPLPTSCPISTPTPIDSKQENAASYDLNDFRMSNELLLDLEPQPHLDSYPGWEFINEHI